MPVADQGVTANHSSHGAHAPLTGPLGNGVPLRIMALGASITYGSTDRVLPFSLPTYQPIFGPDWR